MSEGSPGAPGIVRRVAAGAWNVPAGLLFLANRPRLWGLAALPAFLAAALTVGGFVLGLYSGPSVEGLLMRRLGLSSLPDWMGFLTTLAVWVGTTCACTFGGLALALLLTAPVLDVLSKRVQESWGSGPGAATTGPSWEIMESLRGGLYFAVRAPGVFLVGLVPVLGPFLSTLWAAHSLAFQSTERALGRRGLDFASRRAWHRRFRAESLGLGLAGLVTLLVPCAGFLLAPTLVTGGTLLVLELTETEDVPPVTLGHGEG